MSDSGLPMLVINNNGVDVSSYNFPDYIYYDDAFHFYLQPGNYKISARDKVNMLTTGSGFFIDVKKVPVNIEVTLVYDNYDLIRALNKIAKKAIDNLEPLTVIDYNFTEYNTPDNNGITRQGFLQFPINPTNSSKVKDQISDQIYNLEGFTIFFMECNLR